MRLASSNRFRVAIATLAFALAFAATVPAANAGVRVWVGESWDMFERYDDVVVSMRADQDCHVAIVVVDTDGFLHLVRPQTDGGDTRVTAGRVTQFDAEALGFNRLSGRGIAHVFVVGSRVPVAFDRWGESLAVGRFGYRVEGDPYVAVRSLVSSGASGPVSIGAARFFIGEWKRYPSFLCQSHDGVHVQVGSHCESCAPLFERYRLHVASPSTAFEGDRAVPANMITSGAIVRAGNDERRRAIERSLRPAAQSRIDARVVSSSRSATRDAKTVSAKPQSSTVSVASAAADPTDSARKQARGSAGGKGGGATGSVSRQAR